MLRNNRCCHSMSSFFFEAVLAVVQTCLLSLQNAMTIIAPDTTFTNTFKCMPSTWQFSMGSGGSVPCRASITLTNTSVVYATISGHNRVVSSHSLLLTRCKAHFSPSLLLRFSSNFISDQQLGLHRSHGMFQSNVVVVCLQYCLLRHSFA